MIYHEYRYYTFCDRDKKVRENEPGEWREHYDGERCEGKVKMGKAYLPCKNVAHWEFFPAVKQEGEGK